MRTVIGDRLSVVRRIGVVSCLLLSAFCVLSCSVPNLEPRECTASRDTVREFYSSYIATTPGDREDSPAMFQRFVSRSFERGDPKRGEADPFVLTNEFPKAFRVGECTVLEENKRTSFQVLLFWKDDVRSEQRAINVETENEGDRWLIRSVKP
jgi:hypothetical protein